MSDEPEGGEQAVEPPGHTVSVVASADWAFAAEAGHLLISTSLWFHWAFIAIDQERVTKDARAEQSKEASGRDEVDGPLERELHASLVATTAVAYAIESFYLVLEPGLSEGLRISGHRDNRRGRMREGFKQTYKAAESIPEWEAQFNAVMERRGVAPGYADEREGGTPCFGTCSAATPAGARPTVSAAPAGVGRSSGSSWPCCAAVALIGGPALHLRTTGRVARAADRARPLGPASGEAGFRGGQWRPPE